MDCESFTSNPPPVRLSDWVRARNTDGTSASSQQQNTSHRCLRRLPLRRIMNCWIANSPQVAVVPK